MANPSGTHHEPAARQARAASSSSNGNSLPVPENSAAAVAPYVQRNPGISMDWTVEEQAILEDGLSKYAAESNINQYTKIAVRLPNKTVRDVALRCSWMAKKECSKRRKEDHNLMRRSREKKEKVADRNTKLPHLAVQQGLSPYDQGLLTNGNGSGISYNAIGGVTGQLLQQNAKAFEQISANFATHQIHENISLLLQARDNIFNILNILNNEPDTMKQMPALPVKLNEELANSVLPH